MNYSDSKPSFLLQRIALVIFAFLPLGLAMYYQIQYLLNTWDAFLFLRIGLITVILLIPMIAILIKDDFWASIERTGYAPLLWVVFLGLALRLIALPLLSTNFTSDFEDIHNFAIDVVSGKPFANLANYPSIPWATHLNMTGLVLSLVYGGVGASFTTAKMFMVVMSGLTIWFIYLAGRDLANARTGFIAATLYGTLPSLIGYTGIPSGENIALPLITLAILLYIRAQRIEDHKFSLSIAIYVLCGSIIGLVDWFRPGGTILIAALVLSDLLYMTRNTIFPHRLYTLSALIISYLIVSAMSVVISENFFDRHVLSTSQKIGYFVLIGLNPAHEGTINLEDRDIAFAAYDRFKDDTSMANRYLIQLALQRLQGTSLLDLFRSKFITAWSNHKQFFDMALNGSNDQEIVEVASAIEGLIYLLITAFAIVNVYMSFIKRSHPAAFAMQLFILGSTLGLLLLEVQNRYTIITFPYMILLGSLGMSNAISIISRTSNIRQMANNPSPLN
ncbi:MAG TPA: glycosyltransferase family 39 protein [Anaerolineales bacterium]|nr:glycosyltransferase family 39 protein [Anaerolineales bacterium]